jgi:hypothetical protein
MVLRRCHVPDKRDLQPSASKAFTRDVRHCSRPRSHCVVLLNLTVELSGGGVLRPPTLISLLFFRSCRPRRPLSPENSHRRHIRDPFTLMSRDFFKNGTSSAGAVRQVMYVVASDSAAGAAERQAMRAQHSQCTLTDRRKTDILKATWVGCRMQSINRHDASSTISLGDRPSSARVK